MHFHVKFGVICENEKKYQKVYNISTTTCYDLQHFLLLKLFARAVFSDYSVIARFLGSVKSRAEAVYLGFPMTVGCVRLVRGKGQWPRFSRKKVYYTHTPHICVLMFLKDQPYTG